MSAYYNEIDPKAAAWLRELIAQGHIAPGEVDERSILDVAPSDLVGFEQCHFFAGIGAWSESLRRAGWRDDRHVWTGSCPCQPFSDAGAGRGFGDERHLWPAFFRLIREQRPSVVFGEQVASKDALAWLDHVQADLEGEGYAVGPLDLCAAGFGAPHIRQRLFFVADADGGISGNRDIQRSRQHGQRPAHGGAGDVGDSSSGGCGELGRTHLPRRGGHPDGSIPVDRLAHNHEGGRAIEREAWLHADRQPRDDAPRCGPTNGWWAGAEWIECSDGKARPVEPGSFPLVDGAPARLVRLRGYGNAINAEVAKAFIEAYREVTE